MASTIYEHFVDVNKMYAAREQFRDITKMVCDFVDLNKIGHFAVLGNMVRNACGCESSILSFLLTGTAAVVNGMAVAVEKL